MYIPSYYKIVDEQVVKDIIRQHNFGILVSGMQATHLAFSLEEDFTLYGHIARTNPQVKDLGKEAFAIFQGPHGYISPTLYTRFNSVPTWNYVAIHAYGTTTLLPEEKHFEVVESLIAQQESSYLEKWKQLPATYTSGLSKGIAAFSMKVERWEGTLKMSQDRTPEERENIIRHLQSSSHSSDHDLADWMIRSKEF